MLKFKINKVHRDYKGLYYVLYSEKDVESIFIVKDRFYITLDLFTSAVADSYKMSYITNVAATWDQCYVSLVNSGIQAHLIQTFGNQLNMFKDDIISPDNELTH